jgi:LAS superfamily LD-carboxypeptidase LdcB
VKHIPFNKHRALAVFVATALVGGGFAYGAYRYGELYRTVLRREAQIALLDIARVSQDARIRALETLLASTTLEREGLSSTLAATSQLLSDEQTKNLLFDQQIREISGTVGILQKLAATDPELLKKYSKVYFLNENYIPARLSAIDSRYLYDAKKPQLFVAEALPRLHAMLIAAENAGVKLEVVSAYRSFSEQAAVKSGYKVTYGSGANQFSADQGYSEHQLGSTVDLTVPDRAPFVRFDTTEAYAWLLGNAHRYGFVLSYPKGNEYYQFEPWHWRFVGVRLATYLHDTKKNFYDLDQKEIDSFLISLFE